METSSALSARPWAQADLDAAIERAWEIGELSWLLHDDQLDVYNKYREWEKQPTRGVQDELKAAMRRIFVLDIGRRWGKTTLCFVLQLEDVIRHGRVLRYTTAYQKDIEEIVDDVSGYVFETCPKHLMPEYKLGSKARPAGWYFPDNPGMIKTVGLDQNPNGLRGRSSDGDIISEAAFVRHLRRVVRKVLYPQYQRRDWARLILESSAPDAPETEYDTLFVADAVARGAYVYRTIEDNPRLDQDEIDEFNAALGGKESDECQQENYNVRVRDKQKHVVPEFDRKLHVEGVEDPKWFNAYVSADEGLQDMMALVWGYWHAERAQLVIRRGWAQRNASTGEVANVAKEGEAELWGTWKKGDDGAWKLAEHPDVLRWDDMRRRLVAQPRARILDGPKRTIHDLTVEHGIEFDRANKSKPPEESSSKKPADALIHSFRNALRDGFIVIHEEATDVVQHLLHAKWNDRRTDWERTEEGATNDYGHFDLLAACIYLWRHVSEERNLNPTPPADVLDPNLVTMRRPKRTLSEAAISEDTKTALNQVTGGKKRWQRSKVRRRK